MVRLRRNKPKLCHAHNIVSGLEGHERPTLAIEPQWSAIREGRAVHADAGGGDDNHIAWNSNDRFQKRLKPVWARPFIEVSPIIGEPKERRIRRADADDIAALEIFRRFKPPDTYRHGWRFVEPETGFSCCDERSAKKRSEAR